MDVYELARSAWPQVVIPREEALAYIRERVLEPEQRDPRRLQELYLAPEDRTLLELGVAGGVSTVKLGQLYGMNQSTAWRKLERIKSALNQVIHTHLKKRFNLSSRDLESMMNALRSSLDLSISQI